MTARHTREAVLKLDIAGNGLFVAVGKLSNDAADYAAILALAEADGRIAHALKIFAKGEFHAGAWQQVIEAYLTGSIVMEWEILLADTGSIRGLLRVAKAQFQSVSSGSIPFEITFETAGYVFMKPYAAA